MTDAEGMTEALIRARDGIEAGQTPFGACIVKDGRIVASHHNMVWATTDITAHAEVTAIRTACQQLKTIDLGGCTIYSTCEPCPMCFSAIHWARIERVVYGASIADARAAGFHELTISNADMKRLGGSEVEIIAGVRQAEACELFREWCSGSERRVY